jgi:hypothetical protein
MADQFEIIAKDGPAGTYYVVGVVRSRRVSLATVSHERAQARLQGLLEGKVFLPDRKAA